MDQSYNMRPPKYHYRQTHDDGIGLYRVSMASRDKNGLVLRNPDYAHFCVICHPHMACVRKT